MENGVYERMELKVVIYESGENVITIVTNDKLPDDPFIMSGESARDFVQMMMDRLETTKEES